MIAAEIQVDTIRKKDWTFGKRAPNNNNKDILTRSPHHKKVVFSGVLHKINNKYDKNES